MRFAKRALSGMLLLVAVAACPAASQDNDAEGLFRAMEQKIRASKTLLLRFDLSLEGALGTTGHVHGTLTLGEREKYRVEMQGRGFGQAVKGIEVSDGTSTSFTDAIDSKQNTTEKAAKASGKYFRA